MNPVRNFVEFIYNGNTISGTLATYYDGVTEKYSTLMFNYKGNNIHISLSEDQNYYFVAPLHCEIIDKLGKEKHDEYLGYLSTIHSIEREYIIINKKVYNYFSKLMIESPKVYFLGLKLEDGTNLDGTDRLTDTNERGNKRKLFNKLQYQAQNYFKQNQIEPSQECLNVEKTVEYQQTRESIQRIHESLLERSDRDL